MARSVYVGFRADPDTKAAIERAATKSGRSVSNWLYWHILEVLKKQGYAPPSEREESAE